MFKGEVTSINDARCSGHKSEKMLHLLSNHFMKWYVLLSMTWLTGQKSHFDYTKRFLTNLTCTWLTKNVCLMTQKHKQNHVNMCHNRPRKETCNLFAGHHMEMDHGFMGMTQKWCSCVPVQHLLIFYPKKGNTNLWKNTPSLIFIEICTMNLTCRDKLWTKISIQLLRSIYRQTHQKISHEVVNWWVDFSLQQCSCSLCSGLEKICG